MGNSQKFQVIEKRRKVVTYQITDTEMDNLGSYNRIEQVMQDALFACIGITIGTLVSILSGSANSAVWVVFISSAVLAIILLVALVCVYRIVKNTKRNITGS